MPLPGFHGRTEELAWLRSQWDACTARDPATGRFAGGPRAAFILAESGIGKSRLVQALYQQLTTDPAWDPPEVNYWPDAFNDQGMQLRVVPDMEGHVAQGPPRFAWLGARWQPTDLRNVSDRRSALPELRHSVMVHAEILRRQGSAWQDATGRIRDAIRKDGAGEFVGQVADAAVPFGGLLMKLFKGAADLAKDRLDGPRSVEQAEDAANKTLVDEVCECLHSLVDGAGGLPTVLWLDDAQWIDAETQEFVRRTWRTAQQRKWPLLVVVTHWEREWRELRRAGAPAVAVGGPTASFDLSSLGGEAGVDVRVLSPSSPTSLAEYVASRLPGLTPSQRALLLEKAAGNFLTMVENVGQLLRVPQNFVDRDASKPLSPAGERKVGEWESDRQKRVEQRFTDLAPELQDMLGWGSHLGVSFLREVVEEYAERVAGQQGAPERLHEAVDPLVILGEPSEHLREFRDRAFHHVARRHFADYGSEHAEALNGVLRERLVEWVNNSFDGEGNEVWPDADQGISAPPRSVTGLTNEEARDVLGMAVRCLSLSEEPDWTDPTHVAALRARCLFILKASRDSRWSDVADVVELMHDVGFPLPHPMDIAISRRLHDELAELSLASGYPDLAICIRLGLWQYDIRLVVPDVLEAASADWLEQALWNVIRLAESVVRSGETSMGPAVVGYLNSFQLLVTHCRLRFDRLSNDRLAHWEGAIANARSQLFELGDDLELARGALELAVKIQRRVASSAQELAVLSGSLNRLATMERTAGRLDVAFQRQHESSRVICEALNIAQSGWLKIRFALAQRGLAVLEDARGRRGEARRLFRSAAETSLAALDSDGSPDVARSTCELMLSAAISERMNGDFGSAESLVRRANEIASRHLSRGYDLQQRLVVLQCATSLSVALNESGKWHDALGILRDAGQVVEALVHSSAACESQPFGDRVQDVCRQYWAQCAAALEAIGLSAEARECLERSVGVRL